MLIRTVSLGQKNNFTDTTATFNFVDADDPSFPQSAVWFDIETTGLSVKTTYLYMIGAVKLINDEYILTQWISEKYSDEPDLLVSFLDYINGCRELIHFNGSTFDIPYVMQKCSDYGITENISSMVSIDIYRIIRPYKDFLHLTSLKQKSLELFCNYNRTDCYSGGDLIPVYTRYLARLNYEKLHGCTEIPSDIRPDISTGLPSIPEITSNALLCILLQHNHDDLEGMLHINRLLRLLLMMFKDYTISSVTQTHNAVLFRLSYCFTETDNILLHKIPDYRDETVFFCIKSSDEAELYIKTSDIVLKYFYPNYKDYYYLPAEDTAIHKSVADFVDRKYRRAATASTCYIRHNGSFIPSFGTDMFPVLRAEYHDKQGYIELNDRFFENKNLHQYIESVITCITHKKKSR